jgi:DNA polymerase-3 subunit epsilon
MRLELKRSLVVTDVETTGTHPQVDRIVQIGLVKLYPNGRITEWQSLINPGEPIAPEITAIHGITDDMVSRAPTFREIAPMLASGLLGCDIGGFNVRFDMLFLKKEFERVGATGILDGAKIVDVFRIFCQKEPRTLTAAVKFYLNQELSGAHDALVDAKATVNVLEAQLERYPELPNTVDEIHAIFFQKPAEGYLDPEGKLAWRHGEATINFGKYATVKLRQVEKKYLEWMLNGDFSYEVKHIIREALEGRFPRRED